MVTDPLVLNHCYDDIFPVSGIKLGAKIIEGKTKIVCDLPNEPGNCILISKDRITAGDGTRADDMAGPFLT